MIREILFVAGTAVLLLMSRKCILHPSSHGFTRFFAWEAILALFALNVPYWFHEPFAVNQVISWIFLILSIPLVAAGVIQLRKAGRPTRKRSDETLIAFEKTSALVTVGLYGSIRHPMYSSLLFLAWGIFLKRVSWAGLVLTLLATGFLFLTARRDEAECLEHFGEAYRDYMRRTKRFIPFVF